MAGSASRSSKRVARGSATVANTTEVITRPSASTTWPLSRASQVFVGTHDDQLIFFTGPRSRKARNLRRDPRVALFLAPADNPFQPVIIRGRVTEWLEGDTAWEIIDQIATKYTGQPYTRDKERIVAVVEPDQQTIGVS